MVSKTHVVELKSKFLANDLDIVESRALHACLPSKFENDADGAKMGWRAGFRKRLKELLGKEAGGHLKPAEVRRPVYKVTNWSSKESRHVAFGLHKTCFVLVSCGKHKNCV